MGFNIPLESLPASRNFVSPNSKNKFNLKDLKKENPADDFNYGLIDNGRKNKSNNNSVLMRNGNLNEEAKSSFENNFELKNKLDSMKANLEKNSDNDYANKIYKNQNQSNKEYETIETIENPSNGKTKIIIKKKKKIQVAKTPTYNENLASNELVGKHLLENSDNDFIENYKQAKISSVLQKNKLAKASTSNYNNKSEISNRHNTKDSSYLNSFNDFKANANLISDKNRNESSEKYKVKQKLDDSKTAKIVSNNSNSVGHGNNFNFSSEQMANKTRGKINKLNNKTANDILLEGLSPNKVIDSKREFAKKDFVDHNNFNNKKINENFNTDRKPTLDFSDGGYDLENFIQQQNSKKSKIGNNNSNNYKEAKFLEKYNSKSNLETKNRNKFETEFEENLNVNKYQNDDYYGGDEQQYENKFSQLIQINNAAHKNNNKMDKSMDRSVNEISRDQIKEKINYKKNKSILNALNKTQNEIEKFDNNQMNSSVIDVVFSKIEGKNKNKNRHHKDYG